MQSRALFPFLTALRVPLIPNTTENCRITDSSSISYRSNIEMLTSLLHIYKGYNTVVQ